MLVRLSLALASIYKPVIRFRDGAPRPYVGNSQKGPEELKDAAGP